VKSTEKRRSYKHDAGNKIKRLKIDTDWHEEKKIKGIGDWQLVIGQFATRNLQLVTHNSCISHTKLPGQYGTIIAIFTIMTPKP